MTRGSVLLTMTLLWALACGSDDDEALAACDSDCAAAGAEAADGSDDDRGDSDATGDGSSAGDVDAGDGDDSDGDAAADGDSDASGDRAGDGDGDGTAPPLPDDDEVRAFPGAEGFGARVTGGRGGAVIKVTTLDASGPGSLQAALDTPGPRIVVFVVSGVIEADILEIPHGDLTLAGQTAPGGGITIRGRLYGAYDTSVGNMIIRHLRIRPEYDGSDAAQFDGIQFSRNHHLIFDHVSISGGVDETVDLFEARDVSFQWSTVEFSHQGNGHNYGLINGPEGVRLSVHHTLFAHHLNRTPAIANGPAEMINVVDYNVRHGFVHHNPNSGPFNLVGNYFKDGADDTIFPFFFDDTHADNVRYYLDDNHVEGSDSSCGDGPITDAWAQCENLSADEVHRAAALHDFADAGDSYRPVTIDPVHDAYAEVLQHAGALPRDVVTRTAVMDTIDGTGGWGHFYPTDLMEGLTPGSPPEDADDDGMPDAWEDMHGLDPADGGDHGTVMPSGYTAIEQYINELAAELQAAEG